MKKFREAALPEIPQLDVMSKYRRQHFLPACYLARFGFPKTEKPRKRSVVEITSEGIENKAVENLCQEEFFFSEPLAEVFETKLSQPIENKYSDIIDQKGIDYLGIKKKHEILIFAFHIHAANRRFKTESKREEIEFYNLRAKLLCESLLGCEPKLSDQVFKNKWQLELIRFDPDSSLVTSDCPVVILETKNSDKIGGFILPVLPTHCFIAINKDHYSITDTKGSIEDSGILNLMQIHNSVSALYYPENPDRKDEAKLIAALGDKEVNSMQEEIGWNQEVTRLEGYPELTFLKTHNKTLGENSEPLRDSESSS